MNVQRILDSKGSTAVFAIDRRATVAELVQGLAGRGVGALLVTDDNGALAGIVSERDVIRLVARGTDIAGTTVAEIMTRDLVSVAPEDDIHSAMDLMVAKKIRHLPVVLKGEPKGLITVRDLMHAMREADRGEVEKLVEYLRTELADHGPPSRPAEA